MQLPAAWSGQFEFLERATQKLKIVVPATLLIILVSLYLIFRRFTDALDGKDGACPHCPSS